MICPDQRQHGKSRQIPNCDRKVLQFRLIWISAFFLNHGHHDRNNPALINSSCSVDRMLENAAAGMGSLAIRSKSQPGTVSSRNSSIMDRICRLHRLRITAPPRDLFVITPIRVNSRSFSNFINTISGWA